MAKPRVIYWFRTDLRLHDSPALKAALDLSPECLYPVWTWDPHYVYRARVGPNRWQFLTECQSDLSKSITKLNSKSKLFLIREAPQTLFPKLWKAWRITHLVFEKDTDTYGKGRDAEVMRLAREANVQVVTKVGRTLFDPEELIKVNGGKPTMSITQVEHAGKKIGPIPRPIPPPDTLPDPGDTPLDFDQEQPDDRPDINAGARNTNDSSYSALAGPHGTFSVPTLEEIGIKPATTPHHGGETVALKMLDELCEKREYMATFEKPKTAPTAFSPQSTTLLSPHLHFGSISCREIFWRTQDIVNSFKGKPSQPPTSLTGQLLFRDMYFGAQCGIGAVFDQTEHNSHCRFIPWHLLNKIDSSTGLTDQTSTYTVDCPLAETWFKRWKYGQTGFPFIDALMRQLESEGWIHHLGRHAVACFLTRGGAYVAWERGAEVFAEWLLDHEPACNAGNWQWLACVAFYAQYYRVYSPTAFPAKWDPDGAFVRKYVPELSGYDKKHIYEPSKAPIGVQKKAGCLVRGDGVWPGKDEDAMKGQQEGEEDADDGLKSYPRPMFDFAQRREFCIKAMKDAYRIGLHGDDPRVLDGSWRELFVNTTQDPIGHHHDDGDDGDDGDSNKDAHESDATRSSRRSGRKTAGSKRPAGQMTLDSVVKKSKK